MRSSLRKLFASSESLVALGTRGFAKETTGIVGVRVDPDARNTLVVKSSEVLKALEEIPSTAQYRKDSEALFKSFIAASRNSNLTDVEVETTIGRGQLEELIQLCKEELKLMPILKAGKPWNVTGDHRVILKRPEPASKLPPPPPPPGAAPPPPPPPPPPAAAAAGAPKK